MGASGDDGEFELQRVNDALKKAQDELQSLKDQNAKLLQESKANQRTLDG